MTNLVQPDNSELEFTLPTKVLRQGVLWCSILGLAPSVLMVTSPKVYAAYDAHTFGAIALSQAIAMAVLSFLFAYLVGRSNLKGWNGIYMEVVFWGLNILFALATLLYQGSQVIKDVKSQTPYYVETAYRISEQAGIEKEFEGLMTQAKNGEQSKFVYRSKLARKTRKERQDRLQRRIKDNPLGEPPEVEVTWAMWVSILGPVLIKVVVAALVEYCGKMLGKEDYLASVGRWRKRQVETELEELRAELQAKEEELQQLQLLVTQVSSSQQPASQEAPVNPQTGISGLAKLLALSSKS